MVDWLAVDWLVGWLVDISIVGWLISWLLG